MHELSIAHALVGLTREHVPDMARVRSVRVRVGPMQAIESEAMRFAWEVSTEQTSIRGAELSLEFVPWALHCRACDRRWEGPDWPQMCTCGSADVDPAGSDELTLLSIEYDEPDKKAPAHREAGPVIKLGD
jgi:hydrogenase nickel incorporation protein HypA/HybF